VGGDEMAANKVMLKNMLSGEQQLVSLEECLKLFA
jgi:histidyl-tRNA synthetase